MTTKHKPVFHRNGSGREWLWGDATRAHHYVTYALDAVAATRPNGRDYPDPDELRGAIAEHEERLTKLRLVLEDLDELRRWARGGGT